MNGDGLRTCAPVKSIKTSQQVFIGFKNLPAGYYRDRLFVCLFILGRKLNRQNCLLKEVLREREEKEEKEKKKSN